MRALAVILGFLGLIPYLACSGSDSETELPGNSTSAGPVSTTANAALTTTGGVGFSPTTTGASGGDPDVVREPAAGGCGTLAVSDGCAGEVFEGEAIPLDIQVIFDQSGSMATVVDSQTGETRLDAVYAAIQAFVNDPASVGLGVGVSYFGYQPIGATTCDASDHSTSAVSIELLPANATRLLSSLSSVVPTGETPTGAAIRGGCSISSKYRQQNPGRAVVNLLVTDGEPKAPVTSKSAPCLPTLADAVAAAQECHGAGSGIPTFVLGVGPSLDNLQQIAAAGGTERAYLVSDDSSAGVLDASD